MSAERTAAPEIHNGVSTEDQPSAAWGWHDLSPKGIVIGGIIAVVALIGMLWGNHHGKIENVWLIVLAVLVTIGLVLYVTKPKGKQVTTVTARNKPAGYQQPDWAADQHNLTGAYADLTTSQYRSLNVDRQGKDAQ